MSCEAQAVLVPKPLQAASLCKLVSLEKVPQLSDPEQAGLLCMGRVKHGSFIVMSKLVERHDRAPFEF